MVSIVAIHSPMPDHLAEVMGDMSRLGAPTLRCIPDTAQGLLVALEGSTRLAAAAKLGLTPIISVIGDGDELLCDDLGYDDYGMFGGEPARAADIRELIAGRHGNYSGCPIYQFAD